jgi:hypothetical protein
VTLFSTRIVGGGVDSQQGRQYDVARDGRFLLNLELEDSAAPITDPELESTVRSDVAATPPRLEALEDQSRETRSQSE